MTTPDMIIPAVYSAAMDAPDSRDYTVEEFFFGATEEENFPASFILNKVQNEMQGSVGLDELTTILAQEIDEIAKEFEQVVEKNDQLEMRGFQSDEEQKELIDCFQEEEKLFAALNTYADELKISHGYTKKQRNVIYKGQVQQVEPMPSE